MLRIDLPNVFSTNGQMFLTYGSSDNCSLIDLTIFELVFDTTTTLSVEVNHRIVVAVHVVFELCVCVSFFHRNLSITKTNYISIFPEFMTVFFCHIHLLLS